MPDKTFKMIEIVGVSDKSIQQAVRNALTRARRTIRNIDWFEVSAIRGYVRPTGEPEFQVQVKIGFRLLDREVLDPPAEAPVDGPAPAAKAPARAKRSGRGKSSRSKR